MDKFIHVPCYHRAPDNAQVQRVSTPYFCTVVLSTSEKIAYMYTSKIMFDTSVCLFFLFLFFFVFVFFIISILHLWTIYLWVPGNLKGLQIFTMNNIIK